MQNLGLRIFGVIILSAIILFACLIGMAIFSFFGSGNFYGPFFLVLAVLLIIWSVAWVFKLLKPKMILISFITILICSIASVTIYESRRSYIANIPTVDDQGVYLHEYAPFGKNSKAAELDEKSSLTLSDNLPVIDGATALYPLYAAFVQATYPKDEYDPYLSIVTSNTTPVAYEKLLDGRADLIFCAAPSKSQVEEAALQGKEFKMTPVGKEAFVFFVNINNPVEELTISQIQDIYSGKITNWKEVGGKDEDIKAFQRPKDSGSQTMLEKIMENKPLMQPLIEDVAGGMGDIIERTAQYKNFNNAIGYTFRYFATEMIGNNQIRLVKVNGVYPDKKTIENNTYPFTGDFYAVTTDTNNENVTKFVNWITSEQGQLLVERTGYTPLSR